MNEFISRLQPLRNIVLIEAVNTEAQNHRGLILPISSRFEHPFSGWVVSWGQMDEGDSFEVNDYVILRPGIRDKIAQFDHGKVLRLLCADRNYYDINPDAEPYVRDMVTQYRNRGVDFQIRSDLWNGKRVEMLASDILEFSLIDFRTRGMKMETAPPVRVLDFGTQGKFYFAHVRTILGILKEW